MFRLSSLWCEDRQLITRLLESLLRAGVLGAESPVVGLSAEDESRSDRITRGNRPRFYSPNLFQFFKILINSFYF
jgi:hypothetical protein